ncbi:mycofactocin-coupled SDR family oxidoreductase [Georgenia sp. TF02-10]|uniref:mycofactocin-coupled SDR family oxidoreductase n=1 Tax=Georgenia sp. TF02-10 TaxID=2917725 RepID=UPI001FA6CAF6|nr:mycofactocin-coupled SDR family oxidoreductase [Georgenia sp. TF02-10]UNX54219.1 mycofactocin-coupled SDR family oxidoreductase [Georgenia sp. TF02-10]
MAGRMDGKVVFITGAARGQGRSHALRLAEEGADIIAVDICEAIPGVTAYEGATEEDLAETVRQVEALDRRIVAEQADVRDLARLKEVASTGVAELGGRLDGIVANAGIDIFNHWQDFTEEEFRTTIDINLVGVWHTVMAAAPTMLEAGNGGSIVLISSANGIKAGPFNVAYNASKFAVTGMAKSFAQEMGKDRIRVNFIHPGPVDTHMGQVLTAFEKLADDNPGIVSMLNTWLPDTFMQPREISNAVLYLLSDESSFTTGLSMAVDAGMSQY